MSKLEQLINELCPNGVEYRRLENCCEILDNKRKPVTKSAREAGNYPYYGANGIQDYVSNYIFDGTFILVGEDGSVVTEMGTPIVTWATGKIWVNNHAHIISEINGVLLRYLFHYLQTVPVKHLIHGNIPKLTGGDFKALKIAVPPLPVQEEIVRILDKLTELTAELTAELTVELTARKQQYEYYRDRLFANYKSAPKKKLIEVADISRGVRVVKKQLISNGNYPVYQNSLAPMGYYDKYNCNGNTTYVISAGAAGEIGYCETNFWAADDCLFFSNLREVNNKYIYYFLLTKQDFIYSNVRKASIPRLSRTVIENLQIPIISIDEQEQVVNFLNRFEKLCNDISEGLPAEIETRQKQFKYYRNKLLEFKKKEAVENE